MSGFWRRLKAATVARSLEFLRDRSAMAWSLMFPILLIAGFAYIFSGPGQPLFKIGVIAPPDVALNGDLHPFLATPQSQFYRETDLAAATRKVQLQRIDMLLDLTSQPGRYWLNDQSPKAGLLTRLVTAAGGAQLQPQSTQGAGLRYVDWVLPGVLGTNMMFSCLFGLGYVIVRYRKNGYLKRLNATPLRAVEFILAQLASRLALTVVTTALVYVGCIFTLHVRMEGSFLLLLLTAVLGAFAMIALGLLVAARISSEELAGGILNLLSWPMMALSGVFFSMDGAPPPLHWLAEMLPLTHLIAASRAIMLDGAGFTQVLHPLSMLAAMSAVFVVAGAGLFKWRQY